MRNKIKVSIGFKKYLVFLGVIVIFLSTTFFLLQIQKTSPKQLNPVVQKTKLVLSPSPSYSPSPSPSVSSTPSGGLVPTASAEENQDNVGFCLRVPVLMYHHVQPQSVAVQLGQTALNVDNGWFDTQMGYLTAHGYNTITVDQLINALRTHTQLPSKSIAVTVDDGYVDDASYILPTIQKYHMKISLMIATGLVGNPDFVTWSQLQDLKNTGLVYFVDHTWSHYPINRGPQSKIQYEVQTGKTQLEQNLGQGVNIFAYPYGSFNLNAIQTLQANGFIGSFSTISGVYQCDSFIMALHRTRVGNVPLSYYGL
jgi:peptidoglycan/xylan/chitin deacetylase (PgdA/CDA1 family)